MEPEWPASTAHAAGGALSLLALATTDAASGADSTAVGQMQIWQRVHLCAPPCLVLIEAPVCAACCCAGAALVPVGLQARRDAFGYQLCKDCGARLNRCKGKLHRSGAGHICHCCYTKAGRAHAAASVSKPTPHSKRPYDTLQSTQQWKRRTQLRSAIAAAEQEISCPRATVTPQPIPSPVELIHLPTSVREAIRTVPSLRIPSEQTMIKCKQQLATSHATGTGTFADGAYITDPVRFVSVLCAQSSFIAVGGDAGGGRCVLGITYSTPDAHTGKHTQHFAALLVYEGGDSWLELQDCRAEGLTPFVGDSAAFPHIWAVLQHLIDTKQVRE